METFFLELRNVLCLLKDGKRPTECGGDNETTSDWNVMAS